MFNTSMKNNGSEWGSPNSSSFPVMGSIPRITNPNDERPINDFGSPLQDTQPENEIFSRRPAPGPTSGGGKWNNFDASKKISQQKPYQRIPPETRQSPCRDQNLPKELKQLFTPLKCQLCLCEMGSTTTAKDHYEGKKHIANVKKWLNEHPNLAGDYELPKSNKPTTLDPERLYCKVCDIMLSSEQQAQAHYTGKKHHEALKNGTPKNSFFNVNTGQWERCLTAKEDKTGRFGIGQGFTALPSAPETSGHKFFCETCQVACPSQVSFNDHLAGAKHKKKFAIMSGDVPPPDDSGYENPAMDFKRQKLDSMDFSEKVEFGCGSPFEGASRRPTEGVSRLPSDALTASPSSEQSGGRSFDAIRRPPIEGLRRQNIDESREVPFEATRRQFIGDESGPGFQGQRRNYFQDSVGNSYEDNNRSNFEGGRRPPMSQMPEQVFDGSYGKPIANRRITRNPQLPNRPSSNLSPYNHDDFDYLEDNYSESHGNYEAAVSNFNRQKRYFDNNQNFSPSQPFQRRNPVFKPRQEESDQRFVNQMFNKQTGNITPAQRQMPVKKFNQVRPSPAGHVSEVQTLKPKKKSSLTAEKLQSIDLCCQICSKKMPDALSLIQHLRSGKTHLNRLKGSHEKHQCDICGKGFIGKDAFLQHLKSPSHEVLVAQNVFDGRFNRSDKDELDCVYCSFATTSLDDAIYHLLSDGHDQVIQKPSTLLEWKMSRRALEEGEKAEEVTVKKGSNEEESKKEDESDIEARAFFRKKIEPKALENPPSLGKGYFCRLCDFKITGPKIQLLRHLKGFGHSMTLKNKNFEIRSYLKDCVESCQKIKERVINATAEVDEAAETPQDKTSSS